MSAWIVTLLLPIAAWTGWWVGMRKEAREMRLNKSREAYFEGLSYLLNDQTDQAVDVFLSMADIDQQTFDNQLTLGALFRKRGEIDRALHLHRQLADISDLSENQRNAIEYELAQDYIRAGMYAQARDILEKLQDSGAKRREVLTALSNVYEITEAWEEAIAVTERWQESGYGDRHQKIAHYYCEIAQKHLDAKEYEESANYINQALQTDPRCGRAYWMRAIQAESQGEYVTAIHSYQSIAEQASDFIPEILPGLEKAYSAIERYPEYEQWLVKTEEAHPFARLTLKTAETLAKDKPEEAKTLIEKRLDETHNPLLLAQYLHFSNNEAAEHIFAKVGKSITPRTLYQCNECGFRQQRVIWHCPACHSWSSFRPLIELKLEQR